MLKNTKHRPRICMVCSLIHSLKLSFMKGAPPMPFISMKYISAVVAIPPKMPILYLRFLL